MQLVPNLLIIPVGMIIGVLVAAPVGPVNILCIQRAIERGFWGGMAAGIGAMLGDGTIALFASLGVGAISGAIEYHRQTIQIIGGLALIIFGIILYVTPPGLTPVDTEAEGAASLRDYAWDIPKTFFLTITNPGAVLGLFAIFGGVSTFVEVHSYIDALTMVASVMGGSFLWWLGLSHLIGRLRHKFSAEHLAYTNHVSGVLLIGFGVLLIGEMVFKVLT
ncbi:MAG TPA: LysE family transporter [Hyphomicrobium sp.]|nr:LysE family transporter [Hyphomicrobium sp.]